MSLFSLFSWHEYDDGLQNVGQAQRIEFKDLFDVPIQSAKNVSVLRFFDLFAMRFFCEWNKTAPADSDIF